MSLGAHCNTGNLAWNAPNTLRNCAFRAVNPIHDFSRFLRLNGGHATIPGTACSAVGGFWKLFDGKKIKLLRREAKMSRERFVVWPACPIDCSEKSREMPILERDFP